ncbi:phosphate/phosphite/phosphonate ABC transporter substrate-binding protein [Azohydromonas sediminis]|uniref:phosphate/phosphite/phosphonate ABC transporter substrate-binding protein n=1 Tax=Azohydromonas sediminis TaxID=2259674 RepID=UPI000E6548C9|nr:PhnD/SsuA/transferrin family substrate-binding protein [Azohydromonas sediminis]
MIARRRLPAAVAACAVALGAAALAPRRVRAQPAPLRVGLVPFLSPMAMLAAFKPLREHLERELGRPVEMYTARSVPALIERMRREPDDLTLVPAHIARLASVDWGFVPLAGTLQRTTAQLLVRDDSALADAQALRGRSVGVLDRLSLPAVIVMTWLQARGLEADRDYRVAPQAAIDSALYALDRGEIDALAVAATQLDIAPAGAPRRVRVLADAGTMPGPVYIARPGLAAADVERLRAALGRYAPDAAAPPTVVNTALRTVTAAELAALDAYLPKLRQQLAR